MALLNKEKMMQGFEKTVDTINSSADKAERYAKDHEWDKKIDHAVKTVEEEVRQIGRGVKEAFCGKKEK